MLSVMLLGPGYGSIITLRLILQAEYFGLKAFGTIQGLIMGIAIIGTVSFPFFSGLYYDFFGNYELVWFGMSFLIICCIPFALKIHSPQECSFSGI